jgi:hypothetical protein
MITGQRHSMWDLGKKYPLVQDNESTCSEQSPVPAIEPHHISPHQNKQPNWDDSRENKDHITVKY